MYNTTMKLLKLERCKSQSIDVRLSLAKKNLSALIILVAIMVFAQDIDGTVTTQPIIKNMMTPKVGSRTRLQIDAVVLSVIVMINVVLSIQEN